MQIMIPKGNYFPPLCHTYTIHFCLPAHKLTQETSNANSQSGPTSSQRSRDCNAERD